ncbi:MAG: vanadium-dependent haloperoxidase [Gemmatimonadaceae bacterium]|nr:vanadium-dependent haloperoxidase [Gemmatimonadaceae bacterium]
MALLSRQCSGVVIYFAGVVFSLGCTAKRPEAEDQPQLIAEWVHTLYGAIRVERLSPPVASRVSAYAASALYAGYAAADGRLAPLPDILRQLPSLPEPTAGLAYDPATIAIASERVVLDTLFATGLPTTRSALTRLADSLADTRAAAGIAADVRERSDSLGRRIGEAIAVWSTTDGFAGTRRPYAPPTGAAFWKNDAPATLFSTQNMSGASEYVALDNPTNAQSPSNMSDRGLILNRPKSATNKTLPAVNMAGATEPYWGSVRPFTLTAWNACTLAEPPAYATDTSSALYRNAKVVYDTKRALTAEQKAIALYWADNAGESGTPVGHWLSIASQMISERSLDLPHAMTLVLATSLSQADAFIAAWGYKYQYSLLRPRMYIRRVIDSTWEPQIPTPPFPEHPAGHSTQSSAAATVITALLGATPFRDSTSVSLGHAVRAFPNFMAASEEAGMSRIYGGIHFPSGNEAGLALGRCVGDRVIAAIRAGTPTGNARP